MSDEEIDQMAYDRFTGIENGKRIYYNDPRDHGLSQRTVAVERLQDTLVQVTAIALSGFADAVVIGDGPFNASHTIATVQTLADECKRLRALEAQRTERVSVDPKKLANEILSDVNEAMDNRLLEHFQERGGDFRNLTLKVRKRLNTLVNG